MSASNDRNHPLLRRKQDGDCVIAAIICHLTNASGDAMFDRSTMSKAAATLVATFAAALPVVAGAQQKVTFQSNWFAQAEHGGLYQAVAEGTYKKYGLDVTVKMGGPQVNGLQLLAAGQVDIFMGFDIQNYKAWEQGIQAVSVGTFFQKDPIVVIAHSDVKTFADLKSKTVLVSTDGQTNWWPWAKAKYGFKDEQTRPYTFNVQPFVANKNFAQQGYLTSETLAVQKAGVKDAKVFLLADLVVVAGTVVQFDVVGAVPVPGPAAARVEDHDLIVVELPSALVVIGNDDHRRHACQRRRQLAVGQSPVPTDQSCPQPPRGEVDDREVGAVAPEPHHVVANAHARRGEPGCALVRG